MFCSGSDSVEHSVRVSGGFWFLRAADLIQDRVCFDKQG